MPVGSLEAEVRHAHGGRCAGCGSTQRTRVRWIVPADAGGKTEVSNGILVCRVCEFRETRARALRQEPRDRALLNFWVSAEIHAWMQTEVPQQGFSALARELVTLYTESPEGRFDDLLLYQCPEASVRCFVWMHRELHEAFKARARRDGFNLTQALTALILLYRSEIAQETPCPTYR